MAIQSWPDYSINLGLFSAQSLDKFALVTYQAHYSLST